MFRWSAGRARGPFRRSRVACWMAQSICSGLGWCSLVADVVPRDGARGRARAGRAAPGEEPRATARGRGAVHVRLTGGSDEALPREPPVVRAMDPEGCRPQRLGGAGEDDPPAERGAVDPRPDRGDGLDEAGSRLDVVRPDDHVPALSAAVELDPAPRAVAHVREGNPSPGRRARPSRLSVSSAGPGSQRTTRTTSERSVTRRSTPDGVGRRENGRPRAWARVVSFPSPSTRTRLPPRTPTSSSSHEDGRSHLPLDGPGLDDPRRREVGDQELRALLVHPEMTDQDRPIVDGAARAEVLARDPGHEGANRALDGVDDVGERSAIPEHGAIGEPARGDDGDGVTSGAGRHTSSPSTRRPRSGRAGSWPGPSTSSRPIRPPGRGGSRARPPGRRTRRPRPRSPGHRGRSHLRLPARWPPPRGRARARTRRVRPAAGPRPFPAPSRRRAIEACSPPRMSVDRSKPQTVVARPEGGEPRFAFDRRAIGTPERLAAMAVR